MRNAKKRIELASRALTTEVANTETISYLRLEPLVLGRRLHRQSLHKENGRHHRPLPGFNFRVTIL